MIRPFLIIAAFIIQYGAAEEQKFEPMFIEESDVSYEDALKAAAMFHSYNFDLGAEQLGFPTKDISMGLFSGTSQNNVAMFRGIKYATAERFQMPEMIVWSDGMGVSAYEKGPSCPQPSADYFENSDKYSEDCLYLDVYVPLRRSVMVKAGSSGDGSMPEYSGSATGGWSKDAAGSESGSEDDEVVLTSMPEYSGSATGGWSKDADGSESDSGDGEVVSTVWEDTERTSYFEDLPIIVVFKGEEFTYAESRHEDGRLLARYGTAIVVIVNYRTGVLGFLSSGDERISGNYGLYDQKVAIKWVKKNAGRLGGDPDKITLLGFSSGAESITAQMTNPSNSRELFQRVILQSGVSKQGTLFSSDKDAEKLAQKDILEKLTDLLECDGCEAVDCVKDTEIEKLIGSSGTLVFNRKDNRTFGPVHDNNYFVETEHELLSQYDIMIGVVENEAGKWVGGISENVTLISVIKHLFASNSYFHCAPEYLLNYLEFEYRAYSEVEKLRIAQRGFLKLVNDYSYVAPMVTFANRAVMAGAKTYMYQYNFQWTAWESGKPDCLEGSPVHGDDQYFAIGVPLALSQLYTSSARNVSANYLRMITNFAHTGNPNDGPTPKPSSVPSWLPYTDTDMGTYIISEDMEMKYRYFARNLAVWTDALTYFMSDDVCKDVEVVVEPTTSDCLGATACMSDWEKNYIRWRDHDVPQWQLAAERYEKLLKTLGDIEICDTD